MLRALLESERGNGNVRCVSALSSLNFFNTAKQEFQVCDKTKTALA